MSYDDVSMVEAIDLARTLPRGSSFRAAINKNEAWSEEQHRAADVMDALLVINWRLMGCPDQYKPSPIERPGDRERSLQARKRAKASKETIENTKWEDV